MSRDPARSNRPGGVRDGYRRSLYLTADMTGVTWLNEATAPVETIKLQLRPSGRICMYDIEDDLDEKRRLKAKSVGR